MPGFVYRAAVLVNGRSGSGVNMSAGIGASLAMPRDAATPSGNPERLL